MENWSDREKKIARRVFEAALTAELAEVMADFKAKAAAASEPASLETLTDAACARRHNRQRTVRGEDPRKRHAGRGTLGVTLRR